MSFIQPLGQLRSPISTYANLPLTENVKGDLRIALDTGDAYTWMNESSSGLITDWNKVTISSYSELIGAPYSTALDIDNAVKVITGLAINISLLAFNTLTGFGAAVARMFDGMVHQFNSEETGLDQDHCENHVQIDSTYYMPNKSDLDIYTRMLIHGDGIQGSTSFVDLLRLPLYNHGAITDTSVKKFGTGSIKFDGVNDSCDLGRLVEGTASSMFSMPMTLDFWFYPKASGFQPIMSNEEYIAEEYYQTSYDVGEVIDIKRTAEGKISATILVTDGMEVTSVNVVGSITISDNVWTHIAIQRKDDGYVEIWVNGVKDATSTEHPIPEWPSTYPVVLTLGKLGTAYLNGHLDEIRISNTTRYTSTFTPMTKAYNTATEPAPTPTIVDISSGEKTVTVHGNARMSGTNPLFGNASLYLDGIDSYLSLADSDDWKLCENEGAVDSYTKLLLHLNNNVTDEIGHSITNNSVTFSDTVKKFGTHSATFAGTPSSWLNIADSNDWYFDTGDFTIDFWANWSSLACPDGWAAIFAIHSGPANGIRCAYWPSGANTVLYFGEANGTNVNLSSSPILLTTGTWYHIAIVRSGSNWYLFLNGAIIATTTESGSLQNFSSFSIGKDSSQNVCFPGNIDEFRVSKGIARWTAPFTPSSEEYGAASYSDYTVDLWIDPLSLTDLDTYIIGVEDSWKLTLDGTSNKYLKYSIIGGASIIAPISLTLESWQHIAIVQYNGIIKLYVNGVLGASIAGTEMSNTSTALTIGATSTGTHLFNGFIEEVRVSKGIARWTAPFTPSDVEYSSDTETVLLLPLNVQTVPNMVLQSVGYVSNYVPTSARVVIFEEDIDTMEPNVDLKVAVSRDGGTTFTDCIIAKDQEFGDGTLNLFTGSVDLSEQPNGELLVWKLTTQNNKDCRIRGISLNWR